MQINLNFFLQFFAFDTHLGPFVFFSFANFSRFRFYYDQIEVSFEIILFLNFVAKKEANEEKKWCIKMKRSPEIVNNELSVTNEVSFQ